MRILTNGSRRGGAGSLVAVCLALLALAGPAMVAAQPAATAPPAQAFETRRVSDNVYAYRYGGYQSLIVVTPAGVIVTDPSGRGKPDAVPTLIAEIRKITPAPIKYVVYTHGGYDHIAGGKALKDLGATFVAHRNVRVMLERMKNAPDVVPPDQVVGDGVTPLKLGGETVNLVYLGPTRGDAMLTLWLPKEKLIYAADWIGVGAAPCMNTSCMPAIWNYDSALVRLMALDWSVFVPGHSGPGGRFGDKSDLQRVRDYIADLYKTTGALAAEGKCNAASWKAAVVPAKYADYVTQPVYADHVERYCLAWNQGG